MLRVRITARGASGLHKLTHYRRQLRDGITIDDDVLARLGWLAGGRR